MRTTDTLKKRIELYKQTDAYKLNNYSKDIVSAIEMCIILLEMAIRNNNRIRKEDQVWFNGAYQITREFEELEWRDIGMLYDEIVKVAREKYF